MRDEDDIDLSRHRPARVARIVVIASTLAIALIATWVFAPILLKTYMAGSARLVGGLKSATAKQVPSSVPAAAPAPASDTAQAAGTTAVATTEEENNAAGQSNVSFNGNSPSAWPAASASSWPKDVQQAQPQTVTASAAPAATPPAAPAATDDQTNSIQLASVAPATATSDAAENVPMPRKRPSKMIAARLSIPLPRPRPEIDSEESTPDMRAMDLMIRRQQ